MDAVSAVSLREEVNQVVGAAMSGGLFSNYDSPVRDGNNKMGWDILGRKEAAIQRGGVWHFTAAVRLGEQCFLLTLQLALCSSSQPE